MDLFKQQGTQQTLQIVDVASHYPAGNQHCRKVSGRHKSQVQLNA